MTEERRVGQPSTAKAGLAKPRILVVDDEPVIREAVTDFLRPDHDVVTEGDVDSGMTALRSEVFDLVLTDIEMPGGGGQVFARRALAQLPGLMILVMSGQGTTADVTTFLRLGICDYLPKPLTPRQVRFAVARALELKRLRSETERLNVQQPDRRRASPLHGESAPMRAVKRELAHVAPTDATVLLIGGSGTGKELAARSLHDSSARPGGPFVAVNCGALRDSLLESTLFGHAKGAFTGAHQARPGCFEQAHGGTLFLDEVGTMSADLQVRLLRVLSTRQITRLGEESAREVDVRIVGATNADLELKVTDGSFREDLYYRLCVFPVRLPDLRARGSADIELLTEHLLERVRARMGRPQLKVSEEALRLLLAHPWPGNVRELENALERAVILAGPVETIEAEHVVLRVQPGRDQHFIELPEEGLDLRARLAELEGALIREALSLSGGVKQHAAETLRLNRTTLCEKLKRLDEGRSPVSSPGAALPRAFGEPPP